MNFSDINEAIERGDAAAVEGAFRALIHWPAGERIEGSSPKTRRAALGRVCEFLATDDRQMPDDTLEAIKAAADGLTDSSYSAGAYHVKSHRGFFHRTLEQKDR